MKMLVMLVILACLGGAAAPAAEPAAAKYYVQLIRGTDDAQPPAPDSHKVGPKLGSRLQPVLRWQHYWEIGRTKTEAAPNRKTRVRLNYDRSVEIDLTIPHKLAVTAFHQEKPVSTLTDLREAAMIILGGDRDARTAWFIVVRRDQPTLD